VRAGRRVKLLALFGHRKKLLREGAHADAVVTERKGARHTTGGWSAYDLVLEVHFPDGSVSELRDRIDVEDIGMLRGQVGDVLPVRYDPNDLSAVVLDAPAIRAQLDEAQQRLDQEAVARGRRTLEGEVDPAVEKAPPVALQGVQDQLVELTELRRALDAGQIGPDEYQLRRRQIVATDEPGPTS
jgi:hypothetical protein